MLKFKIIIRILMIIVAVFGISACGINNKDKNIVPYDAYFAKVKTENDSDFEILVENESPKEKGLNEAYLYIKNVPTIDLTTGSLINDYEFKEGEKIQYFFKENNPIMMSYPAKMKIDFIAIKSGDEKYSIDVDYFDKAGLGKSNRLKIYIDKNTKAKNLKGLEQKNILNNNLAILYTKATRSLPPQTNPDKIIILEK